MNLYDIITNRRSIRKYTSEPVTKEQIWAILDAGNKAPSAKNGQMWRFYVYTGKSKEKFTKYCSEEFDKIIDKPYVHPYAKYSFNIMEQAPVVIAIYCTDYFKEPHPSRPDIQSVSAAIQNMLLKAYELKLGSLWICDILYIEKQVNDYIKPDNSQLLATITIGHAAEAPNDRRKLSVEDVTYWFE